jgi:hypothetical protein
MEADKDAERHGHGIEAVIYDSNDVHVVLDTFAGETEVPDSLGVVDVDTVAGAESNVFHGAVAEPLVKNEIDPVDALMVLKLSKSKQKSTSTFIRPHHGIVEFISRTIPVTNLIPIYGWLSIKV